MNRNQQKALSLLELLISLAVITALLSIAPPSYSHLVERSREQSVRDELFSHLHFTRAQAISTRRAHILCGSADGKTCTGDWQHSWLVLRQHDQYVLREFTPDKQPNLCWRGFGGNQVLFRADGMSSSSNGRFSFCRRQQILWQIVINRQGRFKMASLDNSANCCTTSHTGS
ncbi:MAG: GspH/FimT family pseudopilin [Pseudomonas sp.]|uniref:GspH/FimT family pseudopilin n=1 Tax=Pseudomonas sp. TaxID=306 RepID=UPI003D100B06